MWDESFVMFVKCLERSGHPGPFWICAFAIYQSDNEHDHPTIQAQIGPEPEYGPFAIVLKVEDLDCMIVVIADKDVYDRLWYVHYFLVIYF